MLNKGDSLGKVSVGLIFALSTTSMPSSDGEEDWGLQPLPFRSISEARTAAHVVGSPHEKARRELFGYFVSRHVRIRMCTHLRVRIFIFVCTPMRISAEGDAYICVFAQPSAQNKGMPFYGGQLFFGAGGGLCDSIFLDSHAQIWFPSFGLPPPPHPR